MRVEPRDAITIAATRATEPPTTHAERDGGLARDERDERAREREEPGQPAPRRGPLARRGPAAGEAARVHRLREGDRALEPVLEHRDDLAYEATAPDGSSTRARAVGLAHVVDRGDRGGDERDPHRDDETELVERAGQGLDELVVRDHRVERGEHRDHAHDHEALGRGLRDDR